LQLKLLIRMVCISLCLTPGLLNYAFSISITKYHQVINYAIITNGEFGRIWERSWPILTSYPRIFFKELRKLTFTSFIIAAIPEIRNGYFLNANQECQSLHRDVCFDGVRLCAMNSAVSLEETVFRHAVSILM
jgi:hypothetical protein